MNVKILLKVSELQFGLLFGVIYVNKNVLGILDFQKIVKIFTQKFDELSKIVEKEKMKVKNLIYIFYTLSVTYFWLLCLRLLDQEI